MSADTWVAVVVSQDGFVMPDEDVRGWAEAAADGRSYFYSDAEPREIQIVKGSAKPTPQTDDPDEKFYRAPSSWYTDDKFLEVEDLDELEPAQVVLLWERAQATVAGMNAAGAK